MDLLHPVRHHAEGDEVLPNVLRLEIPAFQPGNQDAGIFGQHIGLRGRKEMRRLARDDSYIRKDCAQTAADAAQKLRQLRTDEVLRRPHLKREHSSGTQVIARGTEKLLRIKPVQLSGLWIGQIENDRIESLGRGPEPESAIRIVNPHARIGKGAHRFRGSNPPENFHHRGIELHIIEPPERGVLERLNNAAIRSPTNKQNPSRCGVLQQRIVDGFFGGGLIRHAGQDHTVVIDTPQRAGFNHRQVSINRIARFQHAESLPLALARRPVQRRSNISKQWNRQDHAGQRYGRCFPAV